jgi:hypothetical protein
MDAIEIPVTEYVDYGGLRAFLCMLAKVPPFPLDIEPLATAAWLQVYETILAALEDFPVEPTNEHVRAEFIAYANYMRSFAIAALGGHRGDRTALLAEAKARSLAFPRRLRQLGTRLGYGDTDDAA